MESERSPLTYVMAGGTRGILIRSRTFSLQLNIQVCSDLSHLLRVCADIWNLDSLGRSKRSTERDIQQFDRSVKGFLDFLALRKGSLSIWQLNQVIKTLVQIIEKT